MASPPDTTNGRPQSLPASSIADVTIENRQVCSTITPNNDTSSNRTTVACDRAQVLPADYHAVGETGTSIPLQDLSSSASNPRSSTCSHCRTGSHYSEDSRSQREPRTRASSVSAWLWNKGCAIYTGIVGFVMMITGFLQYTVARIQNALSQQPTPREIYDQKGQIWDRIEKFYNYCKGREESGKSLTEECRDRLAKGIDSPPDPPPPEKRDNRPSQPIRRPQDSWSSYMSELYAKGKRAVRQVETSFSSAIDTFAREFPEAGEWTGGGSVRRRY